MSASEPASDEAGGSEAAEGGATSSAKAVVAGGLARIGGDRARRRGSNQSRRLRRSGRRGGLGKRGLVPNAIASTTPLLIARTWAVAREARDLDNAPRIRQPDTPVGACLVRARTHQPPKPLACRHGLHLDARPLPGLKPALKLLRIPFRGVLDAPDSSQRRSGSISEDETKAATAATPSRKGPPVGSVDGTLAVGPEILFSIPGQPLNTPLGSGSARARREPKEDPELATAAQGLGNMVLVDSDMPNEGNGLTSWVGVRTPASSTLDELVARQVGNDVPGGPTGTPLPKAGLGNVTVGNHPNDHSVRSRVGLGDLWARRGIDNLVLGKGGSSFTKGTTKHWRRATAPSWRTWTGFQVATRSGSCFYCSAHASSETHRASLMMMPKGQYKVCALAKRCMSSASSRVHTVTRPSGGGRPPTAQRQP
eukprot:7021850-Alexandrium_andersonii.AAC.1